VNVAAWQKIWIEQEKWTDAQLSNWTPAKVLELEVRRDPEYLTIALKTPEKLYKKFPAASNYSYCAEMHNKFLKTVRADDLRKWNNCIEFYYRDAVPELFTWISECYAKFAK
jgi:hypothetical protein